MLAPKSCLRRRGGSLNVPSFPRPKCVKSSMMDVGTHKESIGTITRDRVPEVTFSAIFSSEGVIFHESS